MPGTNTKRRLRSVGSNPDATLLSQVLHETYNTAWDATQSSGEVVLDEGSPFWVELANQLDARLRFDAPPARHRKP